MKNFVTLILLSLVSWGIYSCSKDSGSPVTYTVSGLTDVSLAQGESDVLTLTISNASSYQEQVSLDVEGVPTGVSVSFSAKSGTPAFTTNITLSNNSAAIGTYNCTLGVKGSQTGTRYYKFTLIITATAACGLPGPYAYTQTCNANTGTENLISFSLLMALYDLQTLALKAGPFLPMLIAVQALWKCHFNPLVITHKCRAQVLLMLTAQ